MSIKLENCDPKLRERIERQLANEEGVERNSSLNPFIEVAPAKPAKRIRQDSRPKPRLNKTETRFRDILRTRLRADPAIFEQAITLRLDPPFRSYTADLACWNDVGLTLYEVKGPHRFRERGIAKAALAAKTWPKFIFVLADWKDGQFKESVLSP